MYEVQIYDRLVFGHWRKPQQYGGETISGWDIGCPFSTVNDAIEGITEWRREHLASRHRPFRIIERDSHHLEWLESHPAGEKEAPQMENPIQLEKPLVLKRDAVIGRLEANLKKEQDKRREAEDKEKAARNDFRQFCLDHEEQIINYVRASLGGGSWTVELERADRIFEKDGQYKTPESKPGRLEDETEKFVRVLKMGAEDTIEVKPTQAVYDLM